MSVLFHSLAHSEQELIFFVSLLADGSLDLSMGAFGALGDYDQGVLPISWSFN